MTMKMINSTSITSTIGVTLMLELTLEPSFRTASAIYAPWIAPLGCFPVELHRTRNTAVLCLSAGRRVAGSEYPATFRFTLGRRRRGPLAALRLLDEVVHQLARGVVHLDVKRLDFVGEVVKQHHGRNGNQQAECSGHQCLRDTACDGADARRLLRGDLLEGVQDTDHSAEQADEWRGGTDGCQTTQAALQLGVDDGFGTLQCALARFNLVFGDGAAIAVAAELLQTSGDNFGQMRLLVAVRHLHGFVQLAFAQGTGNLRSEFTRLLAGSIEIDSAVDDHGK